MRGTFGPILLTLTLAAIASSVGSAAPGPWGSGTCEDPFYAPAGHAATGVLKPGESHWYSLEFWPPVLSTQRGVPDHQRIGTSYGILLSYDADLYFWFWECSEDAPMCASENHDEPYDRCWFTDCCWPVAEIRYYASPGLEGKEVPYAFRMCSLPYPAELGCW